MLSSDTSSLSSNEIENDDNTALSVIYIKNKNIIFYFTSFDDIILNCLKINDDALFIVSVEKYNLTEFSNTWLKYINFDNIFINLIMINEKNKKINLLHSLELDIDIKNMNNEEKIELFKHMTYNRMNNSITVNFL